MAHDISLPSRSLRGQQVPRFQSSKDARMPQHAKHTQLQCKMSLATERVVFAFYDMLLRDFATTGTFRQTTCRNQWLVHPVSAAEAVHKLFVSVLERSTARNRSQKGRRVRAKLGTVNRTRMSSPQPSCIEPHEPPSHTRLREQLLCLNPPLSPPSPQH